MAAEAATASDDSASNLALLDLRLRRLDFLLTGSSNLDGIPEKAAAPPKSDDTVSGKLVRLQSSLDRLRRLDTPAGSLVREIEAVCTTLQASHREETDMVARR